MTAQGLNGSYGQRTESDAGRSVTRASLPQSLASKLHYQGKKTTSQLYDMSDEEWSGVSQNNLVSRDEVADYMRAYEHYQ
jgi:hypothetical protein